MLASPQILILDEATSNLDTESEQLIQASMPTLLAGRTTFVIAHRLSTIRRADLILLLEDGRVVERGTHAELMSAGGTYYKMVRRQMEFSTGESAELELIRRLPCDLEIPRFSKVPDSRRCLNLMDSSLPLAGLNDFFNFPTARVSERPSSACQPTGRRPSPSGPGMLRSVNDCGITFPPSTSSQVHGADTGAPGFGRSA